MTLTKKDELKVGILSLVLIIGVIVIFFLFGSVDFGSKEGNTYILRFQFLDGLTEGASVRFSGGIICGKVQKVYAGDKYAYVEIWVQNKIKITQNTQFAISTSGLIGEKYIMVTQGEVVGERLPDGSEINLSNIENPVNLDEALLKVKDIVNDVNLMSNTLAEFIEEEGGQDVGALVADISSLVKSVNELMSNNQELLDSSVKDFNTIMKNINSITLKADKILESAQTLTDNFTGDEIITLVENVNVMVLSVNKVIKDVDIIVSDTR
ncbi:MAG: MlaD family protein, partial [Spirochaetota bacterium]